MKNPSQENKRLLPRRERMLERFLERRPRLGLGRPESTHWLWSPGQRERVGPLGVLRDPGRAELMRELRGAASAANERARVRRVGALSPGPILAFPHGLMEDNGDRRGVSGPYWPFTSFVGAAWVTLAGVKWVRTWGFRCRAYGSHEYRHLFVPGLADREGTRCCWALVFPQRYRVYRQRRENRLRRILDNIGLPGEDDRINLVLRRARLRAHVPGFGVILSDDLTRTQLVQVVVRDPSTGFRHHLTVPPRFGNPRAGTFRGLGTDRARIRAALAWTFGLKPEEYAPALEA